MVLNVAAYRFVRLTDLPQLKARLFERARAEGLLGTILMAEEGINIFLAGGSDEVHSFMDWLSEDVRFAEMETKWSHSEVVPFSKLLIKIKREIIRMDHPQIKPEHGRAQTVSAATLKRWLEDGKDDQGRPVLTLDTRNDYEVECGRFKGAVDYRIQKFTQFPKRVDEHRDVLAGHTVVTYCTGGIRCEKAALYMRDIGIENVYQLDGGILRYLEDVGNDHYEGACFVFDDRRTIDHV